MAKLTTRDLFVRFPEPGGSGRTYIPADGGRARTKRRLGKAAVKSEVLVMRTGGTGKKAFEACITVGNSHYSSRSVKRASGYTTSCMFGQNPRAALSAALARASRQMQKRSGAFAGLFNKPRNRTK
jgi:hypothetical protein